MASTARADVAPLRDRLLSADPAVVTPALQETDALPAQDRKLLVSALIEPLHRNPDTARAAALALAHCGKDAETALPDLIEALRYDDPAVAKVVGETLVKIGPASVRPLTRCLDDPNFILQQRAATLLGTFGPDARPALLGLTELLQDSHADVESAAETSLLKIGEPAIATLDEALKKNSPAGRRVIVVLLSRFGSPAVPSLVRTLQKDENPFVRVAAARALAEIHPVASSVVFVLINSLKDPDDNVRPAAVNALGQLGADAKAAIGPLIAVSHRDAEVLTRQRSLQALESIGHGSKESLPGLVDNLKANEADIRRESVIALGEADVPVDGSIALLALALKDTEVTVRLSAVQAATALAKKDARGIPLLQSAAADTQKEIRSAALSGLGEAASAPETAASVLEDALKNTDPAVRNECIQALAKLGPPAVTILLKETADSYTVLADNAEKAILRMGPDALPALEKAAASTDPNLQKMAPALIKKIENSERRKRSSEYEKPVDRFVV